MKNFTLIFLFGTLTSLHGISLPKLNSFSSAQATIFLDFDGHYVLAYAWNNGNPINCAPAGLSDAQVTEIFNRVAEDYRPFNINITTDSVKYLAAPLTQRVRIIITPTSSWYPGVGGVSYTTSFTWGDDTPAFVFCDRLGPNNPKMVAECCTHESGHSVGLSHQAKYNNCTLVSTYNDGIGSGEIGWAPVMGNSYYKNFSGWNNGPTPSGCTESQDNLSIITTTNGFTYRTDDYSDDINVNPSTITITNNAFSTSGIITTNTDKDAFKITLSQNSILHLDAKPFSVGANNNGADLDIKLQLFNSSKQLIRTYDPAIILNVVIDSSLTAGNYYILVNGSGNVNTSNYGSLGSYTITGTMSPAGITPIRQVALSGRVDKNNHDLSWNIISDEPIRSLELETSTDGITFRPLTSVAINAHNFIYNPFTAGDIFYRLKVTSVIYQTVYSNVVILKSTNNTQKRFSISTFVHDEIMVNAAEQYQYLLADINGRIILKGNNHSGINKININNQPNGIYVMQIISNNKTQTERIIKQ